jgi:hypothetical protein
VVFSDEDISPIDIADFIQTLERPLVIGQGITGVDESLQQNNRFSETVGVLRIKQIIPWYVLTGIKKEQRK